MSRPEPPAPAVRGGVPVLQAQGLVKRYGHVAALRGTDFSVYAGEILAVIGDNGAGKSTLVRVLSGAAHPDDGEIWFDGAPVTFATPLDAQRKGIETVYQDLALAPDLDAAGNLFLGRERVRRGFLGALGFLDKKAMQAAAQLSFEDLGVELRDATTAVADLSGGQRQVVAVARSAAWASTVVFFDEPTAALGVVQTGRVLDLIRRVRDRGIAVVFVSHNLPEVLQVADRIEVLRLGRRVANVAAADATIEELIATMTGGLDTRDGAA